MLRPVIFGVTMVSVGCGSSPAPVDTTTVQTESGSPLMAGIEGSHRSPENRARDQYRHPEETLRFFGLEPGMTMVELSPGAGWYTEILAPAVGEGRLIAAIPSPDGSRARYHQRFQEFIRSHPEVYQRVETVIFEPPEHLTLGPPGSADMVLTFRNIHGWLRDDAVESVFQAAFDVLREGGVFGVVQHRAPSGFAAGPETGYVPEEVVVALAEQVGFVLDARSEINANPRDTRDHPEGVWTLPPSLRLGDQDRERYLSIGESDRMTLRFVKPAPESETETD